jgi:type II secretory pathway component PulF
MRRLAQLLRRVGASLRAGLDPRSTWEKEAKYGSASHRSLMLRVSQAITDGGTMADGLAACQGYFPPLVCTLVEVGEKAGRLDEVLGGLAEHYEHLLALRRTFLIGIAWPAIQFFAAIGIVGLLIWVLGMVSAMAGTEVDPLGLGLVGTRGLLIYLALVVPTLGGIAVLVIGLLRGALGPAPLRVAMRLPVLGNCLKTAALSRLAWTLGLTLDSGMGARRSMELALRSTENALYTSQLKVVDAAILKGKEFHEALRATGLFPDEFLQMLETAEVSGTHGESLQRLAGEFRQRAQTAAKVLTVAASAAVWMLVVLVLLALIARLVMTSILPYYQEVNDLLKTR